MAIIDEGLGDEGLLPILEAIEGGSCLRLKELSLEDVQMTANTGASLVQALSTTYCRGMQRLGLDGAFCERISTLRLLEVALDGGFPALRRLSLFNTQMDDEHGRFLGAALTAKALMQLEELVISLNEGLGEAGLVPVMEGIAAGGCPHVKQLGLEWVGMGPQGTAALARAMMGPPGDADVGGGGSSGVKLQGLVLRDNLSIGDQAMAGVVRALASGGCIWARHTGALCVCLENVSAAVCCCCLTFTYSCYPSLAHFHIYLTARCQCCMYNLVL